MELIVELSVVSKAHCTGERTEVQDTQKPAQGWRTVGNRCGFESRKFTLET